MAAKAKRMATTDKLLIGVGVVVGVSLWRINSKVNTEVTGVKTAVNKIMTEDINPASSKNFINRGVSALGAKITGKPGWSLGGQIYDWTH